MLHFSSGEDGAVGRFGFPGLKGEPAEIGRLGDQGRDGQPVCALCLHVP